MQASSNRIVKWAAAVAVCAMSTGVAAVDPEYSVAGVRPFERPAKAPVVTQTEKNPAWYGQALNGLYPPHPSSFRFLEDQGNWHTPFTRPGMRGRYDIRGWHAQSGQR